MTTLNNTTPTSAEEKKVIDLLYDADCVLEDYAPERPGADSRVIDIIKFYRKNLEKARQEIEELQDWKDYMLHMDYFRCVDCEEIQQEKDEDEKNKYNESIRCYSCIISAAEKKVSKLFADQKNIDDNQKEFMSKIKMYKVGDKWIVEHPDIEKFFLEKGQQIAAGLQ